MARDPTPKGSSGNDPRAQFIQNYVSKAKKSLAFAAWKTLPGASKKKKKRAIFSPPRRRVIDPPRLNPGRGMQPPRWMSVRGGRKSTDETGRFVFRAASPAPKRTQSEKTFELLDRLSLDRVHHIGWDASGTGSGLLIKSPPLTLTLEERYRVHQFTGKPALADKVKGDKRQERSTSPFNAGRRTQATSPPKKSTAKDDASSQSSRSHDSARSRGSSAETPSSTRTATLGVGSRVRLHGLKAAPELNGEVAVLDSFSEESGRWRVVLSNGEARNIKPDNLVLASDSQTHAPEKNLSSTQLDVEKDHAASTTTSTMTVKAGGPKAHARASLRPGAAAAPPSKAGAPKAGGTRASQNFTQKLDARGLQPNTAKAKAGSSTSPAQVAKAKAGAKAGAATRH
eukprot:gnl/MRDRNA2_/MRDRNA2_95908_c0_seq1.p1 gnl/MRDRNA2_/MRDRNA2_95908_c0~~gnl/MRDRNA2_/MRDRNA2_95908_c0_seq1.p1  ORF type:complete len:413 (-),score=73.88 gnl/MRDRNA2_/MRDRNA2_95908_c0_seq1:78-1271(-)